MNKLLTLLLLVTGIVMAHAQTDYNTMGADDLFSLARQKAFNDEKEEAIRICKIALEKSPDYLDISIFLGRVYAWQGQRDQARTVLKGVLQKDEYNIDASLALADVELWDDKPADALAVLDHALIKSPNQHDLLYKKSKALVALKRDDEALLLLIRTLEMYPGCAECISLKQSIKGRKFKHSFQVNVAGDFYSEYYNPMYYTSLQYGTTAGKGTLLARLNYANRFGESGIQPEVDYYHGLWKGSYGYVNYGFASSSLFPEHRIGAEIYQSLPLSLEFSAGLRYMYFDPTSHVTIYTGSLGWYLKDYWFSMRTYITPDSSATSTSFYLTTRKYFADANNYVTLVVGGGFSPDIRRIQTNTGLEPGNNIYYLGSQKIQLGFQKSIRYNMYWMLDAYLMNQELSFSYGDYVKIFGFTTGLKIRL